MKKPVPRVVWCILIALLLACLPSQDAGAQVTLATLESAPDFTAYGAALENCAYGAAELPPQAAVAAEIRHLEQLLPAAASLQATVYIVTQRCSLPGLGMLAGCTLPNRKTVYLFASPRYSAYTVRVTGGTARTERFAPCLAAYTVAHELGHLLRYQLLTPQELGAYLAFRGATKTTRRLWARHPEEIFAEDFRWLFGSEAARHIPYLCDVRPPGEKEKAYLLKLLLANE